MRYSLQCGGASAKAVSSDRIGKSVEASSVVPETWARRVRAA